MTVQQFVEALVNTDVLVTIKEGTTVYFKFYPNGSEGLSAELKVREIDSIRVDTAQNISITVKE